MRLDFTIIQYEDKYQAQFKELNLEWLVKYNLLEERDLEALNDPRKSILNHGGVIFLAMIGDRVIGSAAVLKEHGEFELAKMAVANDHRGRGISKILLNHCLEFAKKEGATNIFLYSNTQLKSALSLYKLYGFQEIELHNSPFITADVKMQLTI